ncbi:hypothetical protein HDV05_005104 [Chytridiales sp. JEL 0842]|nr:hypothetical protein HDV05_005104 [Chytridiales sp. JEL 0842]
MNRARSQTRGASPLWTISPNKRDNNKIGSLSSSSPETTAQQINTPTIANDAVSADHAAVEAATESTPKTGSKHREEYSSGPLAREWTAFLSGIMFFTRIRVPDWVNHSLYWLGLSTAYFPLIGVIVGLYGSIFFALTSSVFSPIVASIAYTISTVYLTGAFHEDGLADMFDAFGGGWTRYDVLRIMRDSRIGTYGALGLFLVVVMKLHAIVDVFAYWSTFSVASHSITASHPMAFLGPFLGFDKNILLTLPLWFRMSGVFVCAHVMGRWACTYLSWRYPYVENASAAGKEFNLEITKTRLVLTTISAYVLVGLALLSVPDYWTTFFVVIVVGWAITLFMGVRINHIIGGVIGDCLGATNQLVEDGPSPAIIIPDHATHSHYQAARPVKVFYSHLRHIVESLLLSKAMRSLKKGDRVSLFMNSSLEFVATLLAVSSVGGSTNPLNPSLPYEDLLGQVERARSKAIIYSRALTVDQKSNIRKIGATLNLPIYEAWSTIRPTADTTRSSSTILSSFPSRKIGGLSSAKFVTDPEVEIWDVTTTTPSSDTDLLNTQQEARTSVPAVGLDDEFLYLYTSGVTGKPRGVPLTHRNIMTTLESMTEAYRLNAEDTTYLVMPLMHVHGLVGCLLSTLYSAGTVVIPPHPHFNPTFFKHDVIQFDVTWYSAVPSIHKILLKTKDINNGITLRFIRSGSMSLHPNVLLQLEKAFKAPVIEAYAMTESGHLIASNFLPPGIRKAGSVGKSRGTTEIRIFNDDGTVASTMRPGEVCVRGDNVFKGYDNEPIATKEIFLEDPDGGKPWLRTGDYGYLDENQFLYLIGRVKSLFYRNGEKVSPTEVENAILEHESVEEAVAFGVSAPTPEYPNNSNIQVAVVLFPNAKRHVTEATLLKYLQNVLLESKMPEKIHIVDSLPKSASGKLMRADVARRFREVNSKL